jgi:hypothetical protein
LRIESVAWSAERIPTTVNFGFLDRSRGWVDPVPEPLLLRKSDSAGNRTQDLWICSQELWPLDGRGGLTTTITLSYLCLIITKISTRANERASLIKHQHDVRSTKSPKGHSVINFGTKALSLS